MLVGFRHPRPSVLTQLWNTYLPEQYHVSEEVLCQHSLDSPLFDWGASVMDIDDDAHPLGYVMVKKSAYKLYKGPDPDVAHISSIVCPEPQKGLEMLAAVKANLRNRGVYKIVFGQEVGHFFAGCPTDLTAIKDLLTVEGFTSGGEYVDIRQDLAHFQPRTSALKRLMSGPEKVRVSPIIHSEVTALDAFLKREFPGRWRYDTNAKIKAEGRSDFVYGLWVNDTLEGFSVTQDGTNKTVVGGAVFHQGLGENWCALGPIGISGSLRGKGLGDVLLAHSLLELKKRGLGICTIDWTGLQDWYGKHGFEVCRTYLGFTLKLEEAI
jgi:predicted N-acetyltransferase YhbS